MPIAVIDCGSGNLRSVAKALERVAGEPVEVTDRPERVAAADRLVLPGQGAFADCRAGIDRVDGLLAALTEAVIRHGRPFLGICVGLQLMGEAGVEHGRHPGFGWLAGDCVRIVPAGGLKVPHMGWNQLAIEAPGHPLFAGVATGDHAYFCHSYHLAGVASGERLATVDYGGTLTAAAGRDNLAGVQFHPEKSQALGLRVLANFVAWRPA